MSFFSCVFYIRAWHVDSDGAFWHDEESTKEFYAGAVQANSGELKMSDSYLYAEVARLNAMIMMLMQRIELLQRRIESMKKEDGGEVL